MSQLRVVIALVFAGVCVVGCLGMLWGELHMPIAESESGTKVELPHTIQLLKMEGPTDHLVESFNGQRDGLAKPLTEKKAEGPLGEYVYSLMLGLALTAGALAVMTLGSEDEVEKTIIPEKK